MSRLPWWKLCVGCIAALGLLAFVGQPDPMKRKYAGREKVVFWHMWSGEWQPIVEDACKRFNESQTKYEIVPLAVPPGDADTKFLLSSAGGHAPDLVSQWMPVKGSWFDKGLLYPLEDIMTPDEKARYEQEAFPVMKKHAYARGHLVAGVASMDMSALYVRLDQLEEAGYTLADIPQNLEEFNDFARKLDRRDKNGKLTRIGFLPQWADAYIALYHGGFGTDDDPKLDTPENRRAFEFMYSTIKGLGFDEVQRFMSSQAADTGVNAPLLAGNFSMILDGQWRVKQAKDFAPQVRYAVIPMPAPKGLPGPASMTGANYLLIPKAGHCPKGAWEFIKFFIGFDDAETGAKNMASMGWLPYCQRVADSATYRKYLADYPQYATFVEMLKSPYLSTMPNGPDQAFVMDQLTKAQDGVVRGNIEPVPALEAAQKAIDAEVLRKRRLNGER